MEETKKVKRRQHLRRLVSTLLSYFVGLVLVGFAFSALTRSPCLGVADIEDFWRVMRPAGISHFDPITEPGVFVRCTFRAGAADMGSMPSSSAVLAWTAKHLTWGLPDSPGEMDLRQMGILFMVLVLGFVALGVAGGVPGIVIAGLLFVLVDPGYLLFFNSFYADPTLLVALLGLSIWLWCFGDLSRRTAELGSFKWPICLAGLVILVVLGGGAKMQYALLPAIVLTTLGVSGFVVNKMPAGRAASVAVPLAALVFILPTHFFRGSGPRFLWANNYHAVYGGILCVTSNPDRALQSLGVSREYWELPRQDVFSGGIASTHPIHGQLVGLSRVRLLSLYLREPGAIVGMAAHIQRKLSTVATHPRGNFVYGPTTPTRSTFDTKWQFSNFRALILGRWPWFVWVLMTGAVLWLGLRIRQGDWSGSSSAILLLLLWAASQFVVVVLGEGLITLKQHLVSARFALDIMAVLLAYDVGRHAAASIRLRYGRIPEPPEHGGG